METRDSAATASTGRLGKHSANASETPMRQKQRAGNEQNDQRKTKSPVKTKSPETEMPQGFFVCSFKLRQQLHSAQIVGSNSRLK
jgi:hypothetical protein